MSLTICAVAPPSNKGAFQVNPFARGPAPSLEDTFYRKMSFSPLGASGGRIVQCAPQARYVMCRYDTKISVWLVKPRQVEVADPKLSDDEGWQKLLDMELKVDTTLVSSAISANGQWLAVSDAYETKLFRLISEVCYLSACSSPLIIGLIILHFIVDEKSLATDSETGEAVLQYPPGACYQRSRTQGLVIIRHQCFVVGPDVYSRFCAIDRSELGHRDFIRSVRDDTCLGQNGLRRSSRAIICTAPRPGSRCEVTSVYQTAACSRAAAKIRSGFSSSRHHSRCW